MCHERLLQDEKLLFEHRLGEVQLYKDDFSKGPFYHSDWGGSALATVQCEKSTANSRLCAFRTYVRHFTSVALIPKSMAFDSRKRSTTIEESGRNFAAWLRGQMLRNPKAVFDTIGRLRDALPGLEQLISLGELTDYQELQAEFSGENGTHHYRFDELSDGQRALIVLYMLVFADKNDRLLLLDEPDNYVTLPEIQPLLLALKHESDIELPQALISSHHPVALDLFSERMTYLTREPEASTRISEFQTSDKLLNSKLFEHELAG